MAFYCSEEKAVRILKRLKEYGVQKAVKAMTHKRNLPLSWMKIIKIADVEASENEYLYVFTFVSVITIEGYVLKCYLKYLIGAMTPKVELKRSIVGLFPVIYIG